MPDTYKSMHKEWKSAKKNAKLMYDFWDREHADFSSAHEDVKFTTPAFPKFNKDLGPSLDKLEAKKDVDKYTVKVEKAIDQYRKDLRVLRKGVVKAKTLESKKGQAAETKLIEYMDDMEDVLNRIEKKLAEKG